MPAVINEMVDTPNGPHAVRLVGNGPPMMVVPGGIGFGAEYMVEPVAGLLSEHHRLIFVDQRGTGASPVGTGPLTVDAYVADMESLADHFGLDRFDLLGHSFGGLQVLLFAIDHPERVGRIVIADGDPPHRELWKAAFAPGSPYEQRTRSGDATEMAEITADPAWMDDQDLVNRYLLLEYRPLYVDPTIAGEVRHGMDGSRLKQMRLTSRAVRGSLGEWDIRPQLPSIQAPVLLVYGRQSIFETEAARIYADLLPNSELVWVEGGHSPFLEDPKGFAASVDEFFQK